MPYAIGRSTNPGGQQGGNRPGRKELITTKGGRRILLFDLNSKGGDWVHLFSKKGRRESDSTGHWGVQKNNNLSSWGLFNCFRHGLGFRGGIIMAV